MKLLIFIFALTVSWNIPTLRTEYTNNGIVSFLISPIDDPIETGRAKRGAAIPGDIDLLNITTKVSNRFATTTISSRVEDDQMITFAAVLPANALITRFWIQIENITYEGEIKENKHARRIYQQAVSEGRTAGHVELSVRDSKRFMVSVNVQPKKTVTFYLTYEELLTRKNNKYELAVKIFPANFVNELRITVGINETLPLLFIGTPEMNIHSDFTQFFKDHEKPTIKVINANAAEVTFSEDVYSKSVQIQSLSSHHRLGAEFTVQYDVMRNLQSDPVLVGKDHFVHFFSPTLQASLPKQMIFVLDISSSMTGLKLANLKEAMRNILKKLKPHDVFNVLEFSDTFTMWDVPASNRVTLEAGVYGTELEGHYVPPDVEATTENIQKAVNMMDQLQGEGLTHLVRALEDAIYLSNRNMKSDNYFKPMIMLLADGDPNVGMADPEDIVDRVLALNSGSDRAAIYCLSIGEDVEKSLLEKIALTNQGIFRHIYDEPDSDVQLQGFFNEIASPMLKELKFDYGDGTVTDVTNTQFPMYFSGTEIAVAGVIDENQKQNFRPVVKALGKSNAPFEFHPDLQRVGAEFERLFFFLKVKQKIELMKVASNASEIAEEVLAMSLQHSIFTPLTSMSIVKPDGGKRRFRMENAWKIKETSTLQPFPINYRDKLVPTYDLPDDDDDDDFTIYSSGTFIKQSTPPPPKNWPLYFQTSTTTTMKPSVMLDKLKEDLPWISRIIVEGDTIQVGEDFYRLDLENPVNKWDMLCMNSANLSSTSSSTNPDTDTNAFVGRCRSLSDCEEINTIARSNHKFLQHFCPLNDIAGICCSR